ncbi:MAG: hypothetical protein WCO49_16675, partial [Nostocales cyanobacterium ELA608]
MSNSVYKVFEEIEFKAKLLAQYWDNFHTEISQHLPESYQSEIQELSNNLEIALNQLIYELQNPTLTLRAFSFSGVKKKRKVIFC